MLNNILIRRAEASDISEIKEILTRSNLPTVGVEKAVEHFLIAESGQVIGVIGVLLEEPKSLLRSFAVSPLHRSKGVGGLLVTEMLKELKKQEIKEVYLLTETAADYFTRIGFSEIYRAKMPLNLLKESGLDKACPCTSKCMILKF